MLLLSRATDHISSDLKMDNLLIGADGYLKIADYGLCKDELPEGGVQC